MSTWEGAAPGKCLLQLLRGRAVVSLSRLLAGVQPPGRGAGGAFPRKAAGSAPVPEGRRCRRSRGSRSAPAPSTPRCPSLGQLLPRLPQALALHRTLLPGCRAQPEWPQEDFFPRLSPREAPVPGSIPRGMPALSPALWADGEKHRQGCGTSVAQSTLEGDNWV